ncbi:hypothetical protein MKW92_023271 [Papaver armeniacum]|nr:hypothetical protein MKW92_023271 [Papaver armeniacum]
MAIFSRFINRSLPLSESSLITLLLLSVFQNCYAQDNSTITSNQFIADSQTLTSSGQYFKLGFFTPVNSTSRYVGIWYGSNVTVQTVVWVANKDKPLNDTSGTLRVNGTGGNLLIQNGRGVVMWTTNVSDAAAVNNSIAELLDTGNLVFRLANDSKRILWQSFDHPMNTFLPDMRIRGSSKPNMLQRFTSWKSESDPSMGNFSVGLEMFEDTLQMVLWGKGSTERLWRSGPWNNRIFIGRVDMESVYNDGFYIIKDEQDGSLYLTYNYVDKSRKERYVLDYDGAILGEVWRDEAKVWYRFWSTHASPCDAFYGKCGPFSICDFLNSPVCSCLSGFIPTSIDEWGKGNWSSGCVRKTNLKCQNSLTNFSSDDGFFKLNSLKVPDFSYWVATSKVEECIQLCLTNCSCLAYSYDSGIGCITWFGSLFDTHNLSSIGGSDLYIRLARSDLIDKNLKAIIIIASIVGALTIFVCGHFFWRWMAKQRGKQKKDTESSKDAHHISGESTDQGILGDNPDRLRVFKFEELAIATNNFSGDNKLGEGGFGPVYKGKLLDGQEIAVKRLSEGSIQGLEEFKNEVLVILKVQHRNLVKLLGCCIQGEEKMLIYEYLPNKSLDAFLFDSTKRELLDWKTRFQIIEGVSRGVLYLHRDSRLKVIHRDLKASNILLDEFLNPKISDFGMARIFGGNEHHANTARVVGTFGYMSPEYLLEGRFSEKSDVFSFGVLLLEVVSGQKITHFHHIDLSLSLLGYAWQLWNESKMELFMDPILLRESACKPEILRCIHVGLLCVQELAKDRPSMSTVLSMLTNEITTLPTPEPPAFKERRVSSQSGSFPQGQESVSANNLTISNMEGR